MENLIIKEMKNDYYRVTPRKGFVLYNIKTKLKHSIAITKHPELYIEIEE